MNFRYADLNKELFDKVVAFSYSIGSGLLLVTADEWNHDDDRYSDDNITITLSEYRQNDTTIYVTDVELSSAEYLKTALARNSYGRNVTQKTSAMAEDNKAILAINGDYYGAREKGYVLRNGILYRETTTGEQMKARAYLSVKLLSS